LLIGVTATLVLAHAIAPALAQKKYDEGASDTEIRIGNTSPYSGPASAYGTIGKTTDAYFKMINEKGGINGRKITFITYDDGYSPPKTAEMARKLVESDKVLLIFNSLGTPTNVAIHKYMNENGVPQLFVVSGASKWGSPKEYPWTMGFQPNYLTEGAIYAKHIMANVQDAKIAVLMQNDDLGKDYLSGLKQGLGKAADRIVRVATYEVADPTVDSQMIQLKGSGANTFVNITTAKFAAQAIRKAAELGWKPAHYVVSISSTVGSVIKPAGFENAQGIITAVIWKDPTDPRWAQSPDFLEWKSFMQKYYPTGNMGQAENGYAYAVSSLMTHVLKRCGDDLTRANVMRQAANLKDIELLMLLPGIKVNTSPTDFYPIKAMHLQRFKGETWELFGDVLSNQRESQ
jgi:branched-chain amino acid transport system substrate-binding protein